MFGNFGVPKSVCPPRIPSHAVFKISMVSLIIDLSNFEVFRLPSEICAQPVMLMLDSVSLENL
jgi:hypothetical protein